MLLESSELNLANKAASFLHQTDNLLQAERETRLHPPSWSFTNDHSIG